MAGDDKAHLGRAAMRSGTWGAAQPAQALDGSGRALPLYLDGCVSCAPPRSFRTTCIRGGREQPSRHPARLIGPAPLFPQWSRPDALRVCCLPAEQGHRADTERIRCARTSARHEPTSPRDPSPPGITFSPPVWCFAGLASVSPRHTLHNLLRIYAAAFVVRPSASFAACALRAPSSAPPTEVYLRPHQVETTASDGSFPPRQPLESLPWQGPAAQHPLALSGRSESAGILNPPGLVSAPLPPRLDFLEQAHQQQLPGAAGDADASAARTSGTPVPAAAASRPATPLLGV